MWMIYMNRQAAHRYSTCMVNCDGLAAQHSEKDGCIWEHKTYSLDNCMKTAVTCAQILYGLARLCP